MMSLERDNEQYQHREGVLSQEVGSARLLES